MEIVFCSIRTQLSEPLLADNNQCFKMFVGSCLLIFVTFAPRERGGLVVNASDSGSRGRGFGPHSGQTVLCPWARHIYSPKVLVIPRKRWLRPNMTEKLFTGTLRINQSTNHPTFAPIENFKHPSTCLNYMKKLCFVFVLILV